MTPVAVIDDVLWLVPARAGSKSVPNKNVRLLAGAPLMAHRIRSARAISPEANVWVSTDDDGYAAIAIEAGASVPFIRPADLATDTTSSMRVVEHAMEFAESLGKSFWALGLLEPTSPFVPAALLREAVDELRAETAATALVAVRRVSPASYFVQPRDRWLSVLGKRLASGSGQRRQDVPEEITPAGGLYLATWSHLRSGGSFYSEKTLAFEVSDACGLEIDEPIDWLWAEFLVDQGEVVLDGG